MWRPERRRQAQLPLKEAVALGALHGPGELLPISSSGHLTVIPWLLSWRYVDLDAQLRKSFEVALHAGSAAGLLIALRAEVAEGLHELSGPRLSLLVLSSIPAALAGFLLEQ